jgi:hypothetical protein
VTNQAVIAELLSDAFCHSHFSPWGYSAVDYALIKQL